MAFSYSQIDTWQKCPLRYAYQYIDRVPAPKPASLHLLLGTAVHDAFEFLYKHVGFFNTPPLQAIIEEYTTVRKSELSQIYAHNGPNCFTPEDLATFFQRGEHYLSRYYDTYHPFDQAIPMAVESFVTITLDQGIVFKGKVDRLDIDKTTMTIVDYKTNMSLPSDDHDTITEQITLYAIGVRQAYRSKIQTLLGKAIYLHLRETVERTIDTQKMEQVRQKYVDIATRFLHQKELWLQGDKSSFPYQEGIRCRDCAYQSLCPLFGHTFANDEAIDGMKEDSVKKLIDEFARIAMQYNELKQQKDKYAKILGDYAARHGYKKLYGNEYKVAIQETITYKAVRDHLDELKTKLAADHLLDELVDIPYYKLSKPFTDGRLQFENYKTCVEKSTSRSAGRPTPLGQKESTDDDED